MRKNNRPNNTSSNRGLVKWKSLYDLETLAFNQGDGLERATFFSFSKTEVSAASSMLLQLFKVFFSEISIFNNEVNTVDRTVQENANLFPFPERTQRNTQHHVF